MSSFFPSFADLSFDRKKLKSAGAFGFVLPFGASAAVLLIEAAAAGAAFPEAALPATKNEDNAGSVSCSTGRDLVEVDALLPGPAASIPRADVDAPALAIRIERLDPEAEEEDHDVAEPLLLFEDGLLSES